MLLVLIAWLSYSLACAEGNADIDDDTDEPSTNKHLVSYKTSTEADSGKITIEPTKVSQIDSVPVAPQPVPEGDSHTHTQSHIWYWFLLIAGIFLAVLIVIMAMYWPSLKKFLVSSYERWRPTIMNVESDDTKTEEAEGTVTEMSPEVTNISRRSGLPHIEISHKNVGEDMLERYSESLFSLLELMVRDSRNFTPEARLRLQALFERHIQTLRRELQEPMLTTSYREVAVETGTLQKVRGSGTHEVNRPDKVMTGLASTLREKRESASHLPEIIMEYNSTCEAPDEVRRRWFESARGERVTIKESGHTSSAAMDTQKPVVLDQDDAGMFLVVSSHQTAYLLPNFVVKAEQWNTLRYCYEVNGLPQDEAKRQGRIVAVRLPTELEGFADGRWNLKRKGVLEAQYLGPLSTNGRAVS